MSNEIEVCKTCNGTGIEYDGAGHTCTACNGIAAPVVEPNAGLPHKVETLGDFLSRTDNSAPAVERHQHEWDINEHGTATVCSICGIRSSDAVVERQPVADENSWRLDPSKRCPNCVGHGTYLDGATCGTCKGSGKPPELAELQATIARLHEVSVVCATAEQERDQLKAEIERLKGGQGEPQVMGRVYTDDGVTKCELNSIGRSLPDHTPLYTSQPAPVSILPDDWQDQLLAEMERRFDLRKQIDDDHMVNDDTQVGVEFARDWIAEQLDKVKELNQ